MNTRFSNTSRSFRANTVIYWITSTVRAQHSVNTSQFYLHTQPGNSDEKHTRLKPPGEYGVWVRFCVQQIWSCEVSLEIPSKLHFSLKCYNQIKFQHDIPVVIKHCQRHNGPEGWVHLAKVTSWSHITSSNTNLNHISSSESRLSIN